MSERAICRGCGDVIGVYEVAFVVVRGIATERANAEVQLRVHAEGGCYHRACLEGLGEVDDRDDGLVG